jgi:hypothetical protein
MVFHHSFGTHTIVGDHLLVQILTYLTYNGRPEFFFQFLQRIEKASHHTSPWFEPDLRLIEEVLGVGFFYYGSDIGLCIR